MRGLKQTQQYHEEHTGLAYDPFKIKAGEEPKVVRVLALAEPDDNQPDRPVIQSLFIHNKFRVINSTRCLTQEDEADPTLCPLCRVNCPRSLRTFIPVRVRADEKKDRVQMIEYGRNALAEVQSCIEEMQNGDITICDIKIKRIGKEKKTQYKWILLANTERGLNEAELSLKVPDIGEDFPIKDESEIEKIAMQFERSNGVKKVDDDGDAVSDDDDDSNLDDELPF